MKIEIKGLKVMARHGVLEEEKRNVQPFIFDVIIEAENGDCAVSDDVGETVNYAEVCAAVDGFCRDNSFNLIETLAARTARKIAEEFPLVNRVTVTVHKPQAPVGLPFGDVSVTAEVERVKAVLSIGSSCGDKKAALDGAVAALAASDGIKVLKVSSYVETEPYGGVAKNMFLNCAVLAECLIPARALLKRINEIEAGFGRKRNIRWEDRTLDIDIIFFGSKVIAEEGLCVPHPDYYNRPFVLGPVKEIAPSLVCPLLNKRISDM